MRCFGLSSFFVRSSLAFGLLVVLTGCDLGTYETRREQATQSIAARARLGELLGSAVTVPDKNSQSTGVSLTLPKAVGGNMAAAAGMPGAVEGIVGAFDAGGNGGGPMALIGGVPIAEGPADKVTAAVDAALRAIAPGATVTMPDTGRADVKRISVVGPQTFNIKADANAAPAPQNVPGWSDAFIVTAPQHVAIIIFRTSDANDADKSFREAVDAAARTIQVGTAAPPAPAGGAAGGAAQPMPMGP
jgi:hypothetical protein